MKRYCAICGNPITSDEDMRLRLDVDFIEHGNSGHLIRIEPGSIASRLRALADRETGLARGFPDAIATLLEAADVQETQTST